MSIAGATRDGQTVKEYKGPQPGRAGLDMITESEGGEAESG